MKDPSRFRPYRSTLLRRCFSSLLHLQKAGKHPQHAPFPSAEPAKYLQLLGSAVARDVGPHRLTEPNINARKAEEVSGRPDVVVQVFGKSIMQCVT